MIQYTYDVFDLEINDFIGLGVTIGIVSQLTGINKNNVPRQAANKLTYQKRYKITHREKPSNEKPKSNRALRPEELEFMDKWERMRKAVQLLKEGKGKIVCRCGKRFVVKI